MRVKPKSNREYTTSENYENYANSLGVNPEELEGFHEERILPRRYTQRMTYSERYNAYDELEDDLYDDQIEYETRQKNKITFDRKLSISEMDELSDEEYLAYSFFLLDLASEKDNI